MGRVLRWGFGGLVLAATVGLGAWGVHAWGHWSRTRLDALPKAVAHRADLRVTIKAGGTIQSARQTPIVCELQRLSTGGQGGAAVAGGASTIISLVPDGTPVKKGQVICQLDASTYEELVRQQQIIVEQARAERLQAESTLKAVEMALREFRDGLLKQNLQELEAQVAMAESDKTRLIDRLGWSERMFRKGYVAKSQVVTDRQSLLTATITLERAQEALDVFRRYTMPTELRTYETDVKMARNELDYQELRFQRQVERLAHFQLQVEHCTIRAPHDGLVVYNNPRNRRYTIEEGLPVNEKMKLFDLPDLSQMQVEAMLHESVVNRVRAGQPARVEIEAMSGRLLEGHVVSIVPVPRSLMQNRMQSDEVKNYIGYVELSAIPEGLKPGMTAEIEILTGGREDALVIPTAALTVEDGQDVCYVARPDGLERRRVKLGESTPELLEVTEGIHEGEEVVLDPSRIADLPALVTETPEGPDLDGPDRPGLADALASSPQPAN